MENGLQLVVGTFCVCLAFGAFGVALWAAHMAIKANIRLVGLENSTHQIQYVAAEPPGQRNADDDEFGLPSHDDVDQTVRRGERSSYEAAGDLDDETFTN
jgi:hypothetical protein